MSLTPRCSSNRWTAWLAEDWEMLFSAAPREKLAQRTTSQKIFRASTCMTVWASLASGEPSPEGDRPSFVPHIPHGLGIGPAAPPATPGDSARSKMVEYPASVRQTSRRRVALGSRSARPDSGRAIVTGDIILRPVRYWDRQ